MKSGFVYEPIDVDLTDVADVALLHRGEYAKRISPKYLEYVRSMGFPHYDYSNEEMVACFDKLTKFDATTLLTPDGLKMNSQFTRLASIYFPEMFSVKVDTAWSPMESFMNDKQLSLAIELCAVRGTKPFKAGNLRIFLRFVNGSQYAYNFRPDVAKYIYTKYGNEGNVYDFSMGYGGRLTGFLASNCKEYVGVDVNSANFAHYQQIIDAYNVDKKVSAIKCPAEDFRPEQYKDYFDVAFSSPPYFSKEHYSDDPDQSYLRYTGYEGWCEGFLKRMIENAYYMIKPKGTFAINIATVKVKGKVCDLETPTVKYAEACGFRLVEIVYYKLSRVMGAKKVGEYHEQKGEKIFIFVKE